MTAEVEPAPAGRRDRVRRAARDRARQAREWALTNPPGIRVRETIVVRGPAASEVTARMIELMTERGECSVASVGPGAYVFARTVQPAPVAAGTVALSVLSFGAALGLRWVKRTEECTIRVAENPLGAALTVVGVVPREVLGSLRAELGLARHVRAQAAATAPVAEPIAPSLAPSAPESQAFDTQTWTRGRGGETLDRPTPIHANQQVTPDETRTTRRPIAGGPALWLELSDGQQVVFHGRILVGRNPEAGGANDVRIVRVNDPDRGVSKNHFRLFASPQGSWIEDLHSTNGTVVVHPTKGSRALVPGERVAVGEGAEIRFGGVTARVIRG